tara:strand:+ start:267 stop:446 length:180 start_codon:yes stop_codon:yes gene_type:complete
MDLQKLGVFFGNFTWDELNELWSTSSDYIGDEDYLLKSITSSQGSLQSLSDNVSTLRSI